MHACVIKSPKCILLGGKVLILRNILGKIVNKNYIFGEMCTNFLGDLFSCFFFFQKKQTYAEIG